MNDPRFPEFRVNLVELKEWKPYDPSDKIMDWASEDACEAFHHMSSDDLEHLVNDLATARGKRGGKPRRKFTSEEIAWLAEMVEQNDGQVETTRHAILDAMTWMYEAAYMPTKDDITDAMEGAVEKLIDDYPLNHDLWQPVLEIAERRSGPKEWSPRKRLPADQIIRDLMKGVTFEQEENHYDRYLVFDFRNVQAVHDLLSRSYWDRPSLENTLRQEFKDLSDTFLWRFFDALKEGMRDLDIENRADWRKAWRQMLSDHEVTSDAQKEMAEAVKQMPPAKEGEDA